MISLGQDAPAYLIMNYGESPTESFHVMEETVEAKCMINILLFVYYTKFTTTIIGRDARIFPSQLLPLRQQRST